MLHGSPRIVTADIGASYHPTVVPCPEEETQDGGIAYARFPPAEPTRYRDGLLPDYRPDVKYGRAG